MAYAMLGQNAPPFRIGEFPFDYQVGLGTGATANYRPAFYLDHSINPLVQNIRQVT